MNSLMFIITHLSKKITRSALRSCEMGTFAFFLNFSSFKVFLSLRQYLSNLELFSLNLADNHKNSLATPYQIFGR